MNNIAKNIKEQRQKNNLTQQDLADKLFVTRQCISRWEQGKTLPDIVKLDLLANELNCTINDLIDDESIRSITVREAFRNKSRSKMIWLSVGISLLAIVLTIISSLLGTKDNEYIPQMYRTYTYVEKIDEATNRIHFVDTSDETLLPLFDLAQHASTILDPNGEFIHVNELLVGDKVYLEVDLNNGEFHVIQVIDHYVEIELFGVFVSATGLSYNSLHEVKGDHRVIFIETHDGGSSSRYHYAIDYDYVIDGNTYEVIRDIYIKYNPLAITNDIEIGLMTSEGMEIVDTIDPLEVGQFFTYQGEYKFDDPDEDWLDTVSMTYNVYVEWEFPYTSIEVNEYDNLNNLVRESTITNIDELRNFKAHEDALRCLVQVNTTRANRSVSWEEKKVYELLLGESIEVIDQTEFGLTYTDWFRFN